MQLGEHVLIISHRRPFLAPRTELGGEGAVPVFLLLKLLAEHGGLLLLLFVRVVHLLAPLRLELIQDLLAPLRHEVRLVGRLVAHAPRTCHAAPFVIQPHFAIQRVDGIYLMESVGQLLLLVGCECVYRQPLPVQPLALGLLHGRRVKRGPQYHFLDEPHRALEINTLLVEVVAVFLRALTVAGRGVAQQHEQPLQPLCDTARERLVLRHDVETLQYAHQRVGVKPVLPVLVQLKKKLHVGINPAVKHGHGALVHLHRTRRERDGHAARRFGHFVWRCA
mmetsp:Transcript_45223/g.124271  ORF Transcript_45223/g.124271 Transcript_45223/m.124271 type:complete len:279 (+) Transcript_45223:1941-2777(+)